SSWPWNSGRTSRGSEREPLAHRVTTSRGRLTESRRFSRSAAKLRRRSRETLLSVGDLHDRLAEVRAGEHVVERIDDVVEPVDDLLLVLHLARLHPAGHVTQEVVMHRLDELALDEAAQRERLREDG